MLKPCMAAAIVLLAATAAGAQQSQNPAMPDAPGDTATTRFPDTGPVDLDEALEQARQRQHQQAAEQPEQIVGQEPARRLGAISVSALEGRKVVSPRGESLGEIEKLVIDPGYGRLTYAIVEVGGFLGLGEKEVAVPWQALSLAQDGQTFVLDVTRERLKNAPSLDGDQINRVADLDVARSVHAYYGLPPYWSQGNPPQQAQVPPAPAAGRTPQ